jgi:hypothetical protein
MDVSRNRFPITIILGALCCFGFLGSTHSAEREFHEALPERRTMLPVTPPLQETSPWQWHIRPRGFLYDTYWASAAEPRLATHLVEERHDGTFLDSHIGGRLGLLRFGPKESPEGFQIDLLGGAKLRQDADENE